MSKTRYGKLVRNKIPDIIRAEGSVPNIRAMGKDEYRNELLYKLVEEAEELRRSGEYNENNKGDLVEGVADILELLYAIFEEFNLDEGEIERVRQKKLEDKGGFGDKIFLESVVSD